MPSQILLAVKRVRSCATIEAALKIVTQHILGKLQKAICVSLRHISMHKPFKFQECVLNPSILADGPFIMIISDMLTAQLYLMYCDTWAKIVPRYIAKVIFGI